MLKFVSLRLLFALILAALLGACSTIQYVSQAADGEAEVLNRARPIGELLGDPTTPPVVAERLRLAQRIRAFAISELHLPDNGSYTRYADLGREYVLWNVVSTPALSMRPLESCFPIAGCLAYRGYYKEAEAIRYADERRAAGEDVFMYGIPAYSTLGWFNDPLLNTTVRYGELAMVRLIFHELSHQLYYVQNDSSFNEAFATAVEQEGMLRWLEHENKPSVQGRFEQSEARQKAFHQMMNGARKQLLAVYGSKDSDAVKLAAKADILKQLA
ncbi:aminopeptidase, partial [Chitinimonas sp.]|uniref:aminopeptidase n=1 Tax=Chitinimonas sp. TaxID=1934313 RepID=UPI0035AFE917